MSNLSTSTLQNVGADTPDGLVLNAVKIALYAGATPVVQAVGIGTLPATGDTTTNLAIAVNSLIVAVSNIGLTAAHT